MMCAVVIGRPMIFSGPKAVNWPQEFMVKKGLKIHLDGIFCIMNSIPITKDTTIFGFSIIVNRIIYSSRA